MVTNKFDIKREENPIILRHTRKHDDVQISTDPIYAASKLLPGMLRQRRYTQIAFATASNGTSQLHTVYDALIIAAAGRYPRYLFRLMLIFRVSRDIMAGLRDIASQCQPRGLSNHERDD